jgi:hypothetical protein
LKLYHLATLCSSPPKQLFDSNFQDLLSNISPATKKVLKLNNALTAGGQSDNYLLYNARGQFFKRIFAPRHEVGT